MKELKEDYRKYKRFIVPTTFIFLSIFLIFRVILPQLTSIGDSNQKNTELKEEVATLNTSLSAVSNPNPDIDQNLDLASQALPTTKDISLIFNALNAAAARAGAEINEFSLSVGGVYGRAEQVGSGGVKGVPKVDVSVRVGGGDAKNIVAFSEEIEKTLPLSEVKSVDSNDTVATFEISFFYKPQDLALVARKNSVPPVTQADINLLNELKDWQ